MSESNTCTNLTGLLAMERATIRCHLDTLACAGPAMDRREAVRTFIEGYGGLMRGLYCAHVCPARAGCGAAPRAVEGTVALQAS